MRLRIYVVLQNWNRVSQYLNQDNQALEPAFLIVVFSLSLMRRNILAGIILFVICLPQGYNLVHMEGPG